MRAASSSASLGLMLLLRLLLQLQAAQVEDLLLVVDLRTADLPTRIALLTCVGLFNRSPSVAGAAYAVTGASDLEWLADVDGISDPPFVAADAFLARCLKPATGVAKGIARYNATSGQLTVPNLITVAAVLDAVPLEPGAFPHAAAAAPVVFDALAEWTGFSALQATQWVYERHVNQTTGLAKMNPGLDVHCASCNHSDPPLTKQPNPCV
jgi:hypothetical protein